MASQFKNILTFTIPAGGVVPLAHGLNWEGLAVIPDIITPEEASSTVTFTANTTTVTGTNAGPQEVTVRVLVESWHSIERAFGDNAIEELVPQPFVVGGAGESLLNSAPIQNIVYRPLDPQGSHDNVYVTWGEAYAAIESVRDRGRLMLEFDNRYVPVVGGQVPPNPCLIPPNLEAPFTWNMADVGWTGASKFPAVTVRLEDGVAFEMSGPEPGSSTSFMEFHGNLLRIFFDGKSVANGGTGITPFFGINPNFVGEITQIVNSEVDSEPMFKNSGALICVFQGAFNNMGGLAIPPVSPAASVAPILDINGGFVAFEGPSTSVFDNALVDSAGGGQLLLQFSDDASLGSNNGLFTEDGQAPVYDYPALDPTVTGIEFITLHRDRHLVSGTSGLQLVAGTTPFVPGSATEDFGPWAGDDDQPVAVFYNHFLIADTSGFFGAGDVTFQAPRAFPAKGERFMIRHMAGGVGVVTVLPALTTGPGTFHPLTDIVENPVVAPGETKIWVSDGFGTWLNVSTTP